MGAGIVLDSDPKMEAEETRNKSQAVINAILQAHAETHMQEACLMATLLLLDNIDSFTYNLVDLFTQSTSSSDHLSQ